MEKTMLDLEKWHLIDPSSFSDAKKMVDTAEFERYSVYDAFNAFLNWHGIIGYTDKIISAYEAIKQSEIPLYDLSFKYCPYCGKRYQYTPDYNAHILICEDRQTLSSEELEAAGEEFDKIVDADMKDANEFINRRMI